MPKLIGNEMLPSNLSIRQNRPSAQIQPKGLFMVTSTQLSPLLPLFSPQAGSRQIEFWGM